jgi:signal transduction histidine kinase
VKFTEAGHVRVASPATGIRRAEPTCRCGSPVEDTGIGIAPEMQAHVFGEFNQVEENKNRSHDGTGLGLAITKRLVTNDGGRGFAAVRAACFIYAPMPTTPRRGRFLL